MKIAVLNDTHWGARNDSPAFVNYFNRFYDEIFFPYLQENNIKTVIHLGDVVDRRKFINFLVYIHNVDYSQYKIQIAVDIIDTLSDKLKNTIVDKKENTVSKEVLEEIMGFKDRHSYHYW